LLRLAANHPPRGRRIETCLELSTALDAGCGIGFFAKILQEAGLNVRAFDGRMENVEQARARFRKFPSRRRTLRTRRFAN